MDRWETLLWVLLALVLEKWLDYVERPRWLRRKAKHNKLRVVVPRKKASKHEPH